MEHSGSFWPIRSYVFVSYFGNVWSIGARTSVTNNRHGNLNFRRVIFFRFPSGICFRSDFYIRDSGGTIYGLPVYVTRGPWKRSVLRGLLHYRTCHYGCLISFPGHPHRSALAWQRLLRSTLRSLPNDVVSNEAFYLLYYRYLFTTKVKLGYADIDTPPTHGKLILALNGGRPELRE